MSCKINRGSAFNCAAIEQPGTGDYVILVNKEDLDNGAITQDAVSHEIDLITLDAGTTGFKFESSKGSIQIVPSSVLRSVSAIDGFDHALDLIILDATQLSIENIGKMRFQKVVAIVPLLNGKAKLYGRNVGMRISAYESKPGDADMGGTIKITLKTPDSDPPEIADAQLIEKDFDLTTLLPA